MYYVNCTKVGYVCLPFRVVKMIKAINYTKIYVVSFRQDDMSIGPLHRGQYKFVFHHVQGILFVVASTLSKI
jgi:hypothetical protein